MSRVPDLCSLSSLRLFNIESPYDKGAKERSRSPKEKYPKPPERESQTGTPQSSKREGLETGEKESHMFLWDTESNKFVRLYKLKPVGWEELNSNELFEWRKEEIDPPGTRICVASSIFEVVCTLGQGRYGTVLHVKEDSMQYAMKVFNLNNYGSQLNEVKKESRLAKFMGDNGVGVRVRQQQHLYIDPRAGIALLLCDKADGNLETLLKSDPKMSMQDLGLENTTYIQKKLFDHMDTRIESLWRKQVELGVTCFDQSAMNVLWKRGEDSALPTLYLNDFGVRPDNVTVLCEYRNYMAVEDEDFVEAYVQVCCLTLVYSLTDEYLVKWPFSLFDNLLYKDLETNVMDKITTSFRVERELSPLEHYSSKLQQYINFRTTSSPRWRVMRDFLKYIWQDEHRRGTFIKEGEYTNVKMYPLRISSIATPEKTTYHEFLARLMKEVEQDQFRPENATEDEMKSANNEVVSVINEGLKLRANVIKTPLSFELIWQHQWDDITRSVVEVAFEKSGGQVSLHDLKCEEMYAKWEEMTAAYRQ